MSKAKNAPVEAVDLRESYDSLSVAKDSLAYGKASANASTLRKRIAIAIVAMAGGGDSVLKHGCPDWVRWRKPSDVDPMVTVYFKGKREVDIVPKGKVVKWVKGDPTRIQTSEMSMLVMSPIVNGIAASLKTAHKIPEDLSRSIMLCSMFVGTPTVERVEDYYPEGLPNLDMESVIETVKGVFKQTVENLRSQVVNTAGNGGARSNNLTPYAKTARGCVEALASIRKVDSEKEADALSAAQVKVSSKVTLARCGEPDLTAATSHILAAFAALGLEAPTE